jgi:hypothetical protein
MTAAQFDALAELLRLRDGPAARAARLVMVEKKTTADAARDMAIDYRVAYESVQRVKAGLALAQKAVG